MKERGIEFLQDVYDILWSLTCNSITEKRPLLNQYREAFTFLTEIYGELVQNIDEFNVENVEKWLKFGYLDDSMADW